MKTIRVIAVSVALLATSAAHANLIDLTPGGWAWDNIPPVVQQFFQQWNHGQTLIIAGANVNGTQVDWSPFTLFGAANFSIEPLSQDANVGWNLTNTNGYFMQYIWVTGMGGPDQITDNLYGVRGQSFCFEGTRLVTINGVLPISSIVFLGTNVVPETVNTGWLLFFAVVGPLLTYKARQRRIGHRV
jgi:opacity protein-like surface antigen